MCRSECFELIFDLKLTKIEVKYSRRIRYQKLELQYVSHVDIMSSRFVSLYTTRMSFSAFQAILVSSDRDKNVFIERAMKK